MKGDVHVLPQHDIREHVESRDCWCLPSIEYYRRPIMEGVGQPDGVDAVVVHQALDGRDLVEQHGIN